MKLISGFLKENALNLLKPTREVDNLKYDTKKKKKKLAVLYVIIIYLLLFSLRYCYY